MKNSAMAQQACHIRWLIRVDLNPVVRIESKSFEYPRAEEEIVAVMRQRNVIAQVAEIDDRVVAFFIYELHRDRIELLDLAVDPAFRGRGIGTQIMNKLKGKLGPRRRSIVADVRETNMEALTFLSGQGFLAEKVRRRFFDDSGEDAFVMRYGVGVRGEGSGGSNEE